MDNFNMTSVLSVLESKASSMGKQVSKYIEEFLQETYIRDAYKVRRQNQFEEKRPLVNKALYDQILHMQDLPTVAQFKNNYFSLYKQELSNRLADNYLVSVAYLSLVRDLHFYYLLKESGKFSDVTIDYLYDLFGQTDILLSKGDKRIGLQLFQGSKLAEKTKKRDLMESKFQRDYQIFLFSTRDVRGERLIFNEGQREVVLYGPKDITVVEKMSEEADEIYFEDDIYDGKTDKFEFLEPKVTIMNEEEMKIGDVIPKYSVLLVGESIITKYAEQLKEKLSPKGIEVFEYAIDESSLLNVGFKPCIFIDGEGLTDNWKVFLKEHALKVKFNIGQYLIIHADSSQDIHVKAGAGSGKTYTLVSRAVYLLNTEKINSIDEVAMITFTNEAADNMRIKLAERFMRLFKQTKNVKYRNYLEDLRKMQIQTIPSFAKSILQQFGHLIGLGSEFRVANLGLNRRQIIEKYLSEESMQQGKYKKYFNQLQYHNLIKFIEKVWEKVEQKGILLSDVLAPEEEESFRRIVYYTLSQSEIEFNSMKIENNVLTVADLTRFLQMLIGNNQLKLLREDIKYLFVDEFQDTDNAQINFIASVAKIANIPLLVVGDIKQSIYRFRGANASAFNELYYLMLEHNRLQAEETLEYNYRTIGLLLNAIEEIFNRWRIRGWLPQGENPMQAWNAGPPDLRTKDVLGLYKEDLSEGDILEVYNGMPQSKKNKVLAILPRTNNQAKQIGALLSKMKEYHGDSMPPFDVTLEGTLFQSNAAKDLWVLLDSWLKPDDNVALFALSQTAYCQTISEEVEIFQDDNEIFIDKPYSFRVPTMWHEAQELLKFNPVLSVLNEFLGQVQYAENIEKLEGNTARKKYQLNLYKILSIMYASLGDQNLGLLTLHDWLALQINTNFEEDEAELEASDFERNSIRVMTVHKSKGLEFDTVIIPFVDKSFNLFEPKIDPTNVEFHSLRDYMNVLVQSNGDKYEFGWRFVNKKDEFFNETDNYGLLKTVEDEEAIREETRILYVAMTRAERRLFIYGLGENAAKKRPKTWRDLLKENK